MCLNRNELIIHSPFEHPLNLEKFTVRSGYSYDIIVKPEITKIDEHFKNVDLNLRKCYFEGERKLQFFKIYTHNHCVNEWHVVYSKYI